MNYFAHLHLAHLTSTSLTGNLLGDFVKGSQLSFLPVELELGIRLHRGIDSFTDAHPVCQQFKSEFTEMRRYAGVGLDILFDHLLAKQLNAKYQNLCTSFYQTLQTELTLYGATLPEKYQLKTSRIINENWFASYSHQQGIRLALHNTGKRFRNAVPLEILMDWYDVNPGRVESNFQLLYHDTTLFALGKRDELIARLN
ncbi:ACP phosphodiesterase [Pseudoalteromonas sp. P1-9]|uniref:acyl carrier protein phosphodiesterase n=1 Tax=Pseudoalteromonas sp. P1-9 TaxID=1710354 RepID=UPI0006D5DB18|nr:ACP phosphodiesterase [Pseudoalteromonas sp. P1-9]